MQHFYIYMDDTGNNPNDRFSKTMKDEEGSFVSVIVPVEVNDKISGAISLLQQDLKNEIKQTDEFHFVQMYNHEKNTPYENISFKKVLEYLDAFAFLLENEDFGLGAVVKTQNSNLAKQSGENKLYPYLKMIKEQNKLPNNPHSDALLLSFLLSKKALYEIYGDDFCIDKVVVDEGLRKKGTKLQIGDVNFSFESSKENNMLQLADFSAWILNRSKIILDKASKNGKLSDTDLTVLKTFTRVQDAYLNLDKTIINLEKLDEFSYDETISKVQNNNKF